MIILISCSKSHNSDEMIKIDLSQFKKNINYSEFVDSISYIQLETNDSCLISEIEYLYVVNDEIFIKDMKGGGILRFDNHGRYLAKINKFGSGPGEFNRIHNFDIDKTQKNIYIYDDLRKNLLRYTFDGKFLSEIKIKDDIRDFALLGNNDFIFLHPDYNMKEHQGIWYANDKGKFIKSIIEGTSDNSYSVRGAEMCCKMHNSICYYDIYTDKIYYINKDLAKCLYCFELEQKIPKKIMKDQKGKQDDYFINIGFYPTNKYILLFYISDNDYRAVLFNRENHNLEIGKEFVNNIDNHKTQKIVGRYDDNSIVATVAPKVISSNPVLQILHLK